MATIVLVHGAFHGPWCWEPVVHELRRRQIGFDVVALPFTGFGDDVAAAKSAIVDAGPGAVVCAHSYGGVVTDRAIDGLSSISGIVYLAALINIGVDVFTDEVPPIAHAMVPRGPLVGFDPGRAHEIFYGDSDEATVARIVPSLRPMVFDVGAFLGEPPPRPTARTTYVICANDGAVPVAAQRRMAATCNEQVEWPTDHSPFLTRPAAVVDVLVDARSGGDQS